MYLLGLGILLLLMKYLEVGPVAEWTWWAVLAPFGGAALWWAWADYTGYTKRRAVDKENKRKQERIDKQREQLGIGVRRTKK